MRTSSGTPPQKAGSSDFLVGAEGRLTEAWSLISLVQYNFGESQWERFNVGTRYTPAPGKVLSLVYRYSRELVDQEPALGDLVAGDLALAELADLLLADG